MNNALIFSHIFVLKYREKFEKYYHTATPCSSYPLRDEDFDWLPRRLIMEFADTTLDRYDSFKSSHAKAIADLLKDVPDGESVIFCCDGGNSRSPALAAA